MPLLMRAKRDNLLRLARAMGLRLPKNTATKTLCERIAARSVGLQVQDDWQRLREKANV